MAMKRNFAIVIFLVLVLASPAFAGTVKAPGGTATYPDGAVAVGGTVFEIEYYDRRRKVRTLAFRKVTWTYKGIEDKSIIIGQAYSDGGNITHEVPLTGRSKNQARLKATNDFTLELTIDPQEQLTVKLDQKRKP